MLFSIYLESRDKKHYPQIASADSIPMAIALIATTPPMQKAMYELRCPDRFIIADMNVCPTSVDRNPRTRQKEA